MTVQAAEASAKYKVTTTNNGESAGNAGAISGLDESVAEVPPGYKQTEVGLVPEEWQVEQIGVLAEFVTSGSRGWAQFYSETGALFIRSQNVRDGQLSFDDVQFVSPPSGAEGNRTKVSLNDLLITITGNSVGNVALVEKDFDEAYISQHVGLVRLREPTTGSYVCRYLSPNSPGNPQISGSQSGQSKPGLNLQNLRDLWVAYPPNAKELQAIIKVLSDVDALINGLEKLISKKQAIKTATMQQLLTGRTRLPQFAHRDDGSLKGHKPSELGDVPEDWEVKSVRSVISDYFCGPSPTCEERNIVEGEEWGVLKTTASTVERGWDWKSHKVLPKAFWNNSRIELRKGDVIVTKAGPRHRVGIAATIDYIPDAIVPSGKMIAIRPIPSLIHPRMLSLAIMGKGSQEYLHQRTTGMAEAQLNYENEDLLNTPIIVQDIEEQTAISTILSDMDEEIQTLQQCLSKTRQLKQGMMQELLTGRTRLVS